MLETVYSYTKSVEKIVEKLVGDDQVMINHVVLAKGEALPEHYSDSNVYLIVVQGMLTIALEEDEPNHYQRQVWVCFSAIVRYFSSPDCSLAQYNSGRFIRQSMMKR